MVISALNSGTPQASTDPDITGAAGRNFPARAKRTDNVRTALGMGRHY